MNTDSEQKPLGVAHSRSGNHTCTRVYVNSRYQSVGKTVQQFMPQSKTRSISQARGTNYTGWQKVASKTTGAMQ